MCCRNPQILSLCTLVILSGVPALWAQSAAPIGEREGLAVTSWETARELMGQKAVVTGEVTHIGHRPTIHFINFTEDRNQFTVVVFEDNIDKFQPSLEDLYLNKLVEITGVVTEYQGTPQIVVASPDQIRVVEELSAPFTPSFAPVAVGDEITLATYNIRNLFDDADDPYRDDQGTKAKPRDEMIRVAATMKEINADVLALQEVETRGYLRRFIEVFLPDMGYEHIVHYEGNDQRGIDVGLVSRVPIGRVISHRHLTFPGADGQPRRFNRDVLRVELLPRGGDPFEVWVVHLKSNYGGRETAEPIRLAEAVQLRKLIDLRLQANPGADFLVCGDFNDFVDSTTLQTLLGDGTASPALRSFDDEVPSSDRVTYNREPYQEMIDFILCSPSMSERFVLGSFRIINSSLEASGSDHNPVSCRFTKRRARADTAAAR